MNNYSNKIGLGVLISTAAIALSFFGYTMFATALAAPLADMAQPLRPVVAEAQIGNTPLFNALVNEAPVEQQPLDTLLEQRSRLAEEHNRPHRRSRIDENMRELSK